MSAGVGTYGKTCPQHNHIVFLIHDQALVPAPARLLLLLHHSSRCLCRCTEPKMAAISRLPIPPPRQRVPLPLRALPRPTEITVSPACFLEGLPAPETQQQHDSGYNDGLHEPREIRGGAGRTRRRCCARKGSMRGSCARPAPSRPARSRPAPLGVTARPCGVFLLLPVSH